MEFRRQQLSSEILNPRADFEPAARTVEIRWDPLTEHSARIVAAGGRLMPAIDFDLAAFAETQRPSCPFCQERFESQVPKFAPAVCEEERIRRGQAVCFPNLLAYAQYSSVCIYGPALHFIDLGEMSPRLVADNLACQVAFSRSVSRADPTARWASINANHMVPSGSSVFHPHTQASVDPEPTTFQRLLAAVSEQRFRDYLTQEQKRGERYLANTGSIEWLASFAPLGPCEIRAFTFAATSPADLEGDLVSELSAGVAATLNLYAELGFQSFNMAIYGAPADNVGYPLNLRMVCRSNLKAYYRSDATYLERLHWDAAVERTPEEFAEQARRSFDLIA